MKQKVCVLYTVSYECSQEIEVDLPDDIFDGLTTELDYDEPGSEDAIESMREERNAEVESWVEEHFEDLEIQDRHNPALEDGEPGFAFDSADLIELEQQGQTGGASPTGG